MNLDRYEKNLQKAISIPTVSYPTEDEYDWEQFEKFHAFLEETYPLFTRLSKRRELVKQACSTLGRAKTVRLNRLLFSHMDVVPDDEKTRSDWKHPAFEGFNDGEIIWGRGAIDMKNHLVGIMESVEDLIAEGFSPERTVYICFAHDEEPMIHGNSGADKMCETLKSREFILTACLTRRSNFAGKCQGRNRKQISCGRGYRRKRIRRL